MTYRTMLDRATMVLLAFAAMLCLAGLTAFTGPAANAAVAGGTTFTPPDCQSLMTPGGMRALVGGKGGKLMLSHTILWNTTEVAASCNWYPQGHPEKEGGLLLAKGPGAVQQYRFMWAAVRAGVYHDLHRAGGPEGSGWYYQKGLHGFMWVNHTLVELTGWMMLKPAALVEPMWHVANKLSPPACSYIGTEDMAKLAGAPLRTPRQSLHPHATSYDGLPGTFIRQCHWTTLNGKQGYLRLEVGPNAAADYGHPTSLLLGGPATIVDYLLPPGWTAQVLTKGQVYVMVAGNFIPYYGHPTNQQLQTLATAIQHVQCRVS